MENCNNSWEKAKDFGWTERYTLKDYNEDQELATVDILSILTVKTQEDAEKLRPKQDRRVQD